MSEQNVTAKGMDYLNLALWAFAGLGVEVIYAFLLEPFLYGKQMADWNSGQNIAHWIITCITWGIITYVLLRDIYYAFETALFTLILVFGHKAFELWLGKTNFPYGGVVLALTRDLYTF
ncbi:MAG: hypothetical protein QM401_02290 [Bacillota bacterium]|nr:hypothetical protein [Bacillota bacterium]